MSPQVIATDKAPAAVGPYSQAVRVGNLVFTAGQLGIDPILGQLRSGISAQTRQALANLQATQKQLVDFNGKPLLQHVIDTALEVNPLEVIVVTGAYADKIRSRVHCSRVKWVLNIRWLTGLGRYFHLKVQAVVAHDHESQTFVQMTGRVGCQDLQPKRCSGLGRLVDKFPHETRADP